MQTLADEEITIIMIIKCKLTLGNDPSMPITEQNAPVHIEIEEGET